MLGRVGPCWAMLGNWAAASRPRTPSSAKMVLRAWTVPPYFLTASTRKGGGGKERAIIKEVQSSSQAHHFGIALCETEESEYVLGTIFVGTPHQDFSIPQFFVFF